MSDEREQPVCRDCEDPVDPNDIWEMCPGCGAEHTAGSLRRDEQGRVRCPECVDGVLVETGRVRRVVDKIESEASSHGSNYAAGMRRARMMAEVELLGITREEDAGRFSTTDE